MPAAKKTVKAAKPAVKKSAPKSVAKEVKTAPKTEKVASLLSVALFDVTGKEKGTAKLPESVFGGKINAVLMAQAVRVYLANQRMGAAKTQTRGEVDGSTRKIYRQKGTGRARHGGIRAPIFVGGGVAHGPKVRDYSLDLPQKMKKAAVVSALSSMAKDGQVKVVAGFTTLEKTKQAAGALSGMNVKKALVITAEHSEKTFKAVRNIARVAVRPAKLLTTYEVLNAGTVVVMQEALEALEKQFGSNKNTSGKLSVKENK